MPPHDRLAGRLNGLVTSATKASRHQHEPLLFLYPRWFATSLSRPHAAAPTPTAPEDDNSIDGVAREHKLPRSHALHQSTRAAKAVETETRAKASASDDIDSRPSNKLVKRIISKTDQAKKKATRRQQLHEKYTDARDWRSAFDKLRKHTPDGAGNHVKQSERLGMPPAMTGYYQGDLNKLFLEIYLCTDCHVQISRDGSEKEDHFRALVLVGTPLAIRAAKHRLNDAIRVRSDEDVDDADGMMGDFALTSTPATQEMIRAVWSQAHSRKAHSLPISSIPLPKRWSIITFANYVDAIIASSPPRLLRKQMAKTTPSISPSAAPDNKTLTLHTDFLSRLLERLFTTPHLHPYISSHATSAAISFLLHHRRHPQVRLIIESLDSSPYTVRPAPSSSPSTTSSPHPTHPALTTTTFNTCLLSCAHASDLHNYSFLLTLMLSRNLTPDFTTWTALLSLIHSLAPKEAESIIIPALRQKGLLENLQAKMSVAFALSSSAFSDWVDRGGSTASFLGVYDKLFAGEEWFDTGVANRLIGVRAARGQFSDALELVRVLRERGRKPDRVTLNTLVQEAAAQNNVGAVVACLKDVLEPGAGRLRLEESLYTQLFWLAKRKGSVNLARVVWRFACLSGRVGYPLQRAFERGIVAGEQGEDAESRGDVFRAVAYKVAVGVADGVAFEDLQAGSRNEVLDLRRTVREKLLVQGTPQTQLENGLADLPNEALLENRETEAASDAATTPDVDTAVKEKERRAFLRQLVKNDLTVVGTLSPVYSFVEMVEAAVERDELWKSEGRRKVVDLERAFEDVVDVPVLPVGSSSRAEEEKIGDQWCG